MKLFYEIYNSNNSNISKLILNVLKVPLSSIKLSLAMTNIAQEASDYVSPKCYASKFVNTQ